MLENFIGKIVLNNNVDVTDPCYDRDVWCRATLECKPGEYFGYAYTSDMGEWGNRVACLAIYLDDKKCDFFELHPVNCNIGVDAGLCGFFNNKPDYSDSEWERLCDEHLFSGSFGILEDYGVYSRSGYGDGCYTVYANADLSAFLIDYQVVQIVGVEEN